MYRVALFFLALTTIATSDAASCLAVLARYLICTSTPVVQQHFLSSSPVMKGMTSPLQS